MNPVMNPTSLMLLVSLASYAGGVQAHELRPSVADITRAEHHVQIELRTNLEALISEVGGEHDDASEAPQAERYQQLRQLAPEALEGEFNRYLPTFLSGVRLGDATSDDVALLLNLGSVSIPPVGDIQQARDSVLLLQAAATDEVDTVTWQWDRRYGSIILRAQTVMQQASTEPDVTSVGLDTVPLPGSVAGSARNQQSNSNTTQSAFTQYLQPGMHSDPMGIAAELAPTGGRVLPVFILIGLLVSLAIGASGFYYSRKRGLRYWHHS